MFRKLTLVAALGAAGALSACGDTVGEQALYGAGAGAAAAVVTNGDPVAGAAIGAAGNTLYCQTYPSRCR